MRWRDAVADLFVGAACSGCGRSGVGVCPACRASCGSYPHLVERVPRDAATIWPLTLAACRYEGPVRGLVSARKDRGASHITGLFADRLSELLTGLAECGGMVDVASVALVPIPSDAAAVRARGYDHAGSLAASVARRWRWASPSVSPETCLTRVRRIADQAELGVEGRWRNQAGSMVCRTGPRPVILVDDLVTTGASLAEASRAVVASRRRLIAALVVASTPILLAQSGSG